MFVHLLGKTPDATVSNSLSLTVKVKNFAFSTHIKCFIRDQLRLILAKGNVNAYTQTMTIGNSTPINQTPLLLLKAYIQSQSPSFHEDYLPPGYPRDLSASAKVLKLMRSLLKKEKCLLRTLLLHNIKEQNHRPIDGAVPDLDGLVLIIDTYMAARKQVRPD
ncbi:hypothetical protein PGT21_020741 [Puccinia graminis f. sp. tritici]|uniref:Uncharacterized protein n=1 Tax=Puccinia graminis f. sp. tritici TaxID=56615 RepID=A0A5B0PDW5_PUCGR|nr:hypothetical protein PGTUg99_032227 [Puccinia graminis f. sp. tritici]KAA1099797.1 hypothetical protein PGT21_020741 [Puccinia graminis f. sp. tritici]